MRQEVTEAGVIYITDGSQRFYPHYSTNALGAVLVATIGKHELFTEVRNELEMPENQVDRLIEKYNKLVSVSGRTS